MMLPLELELGHLDSNDSRATSLSARSRQLAVSYVSEELASQLTLSPGFCSSELPGSHPDDVQGFNETDLFWVDIVRLCCLGHQLSDQIVCDKQAIRLLENTIWGPPSALSSAVALGEPQTPSGRP